MNRARCPECGRVVAFEVVMGFPKLSPHMGALGTCPGSAPMSVLTRAQFERDRELFQEEDYIATTSLIRGSPRGDLYQNTIKRYRKPRSTPRADVAGGVFEDPAPDWLWKLAKDILEHTGHEPDAGALVLEQAIAWCEAGNPEERSARLRGSEVTLASMGPIHDAKYLHDLRAIITGAKR